MPYHIITHDGQHCVAKEGETTPIDGGCHATEKEAQDHMAALYANVPEAKEVLVNFGGEVKTSEDGKVMGYLVTFSDDKATDLTGDFFQGDTDFGKMDTSPILYHHGLDEKIGLKTLGSGTLTEDEVGVWIEAQLDLRDRYEKAVYELARKGKLGWSSGTASHLVKRQKVGKAQKILSWPLGLDASLTPTPAEPRNEVMSVKSINKPEFEIELEDAGNASTQEKEGANQEGVTKMEEKEKETKLAPEAKVLEEVARAMDEENARKAEEAKKSAELQAKIAEVVKSASATPGVPLINILKKTPRGDDATKAFNHWVKTGDNGGLRADPQYKTDYNLVEGTQYQGQELVPTEIANRIFELRDPQSIARAAGANVLQVNSSAVNVPYEKVRQGVMVAPGEATAYDQLEAQIFDKKAVTITKYTRDIPISEELMEDSVVDLVPYLTRNIARVLALTENKVFISNSTGAWYGSAKGIDFDGAAAIGVTEPIELLMSLPAEYRDNIAWVCTKATEAYVRVLNTAYSFPFVGNGGASGFVGNVGMNFGAGSLLGGRVFNDANVDEIGAGLKSLMVGNFAAGYVICERRALTVARDAVSDVKSGLIHLLASTRIGGTVVQSEALVHGLHPTA